MYEVWWGHKNESDGLSWPRKISSTFEFISPLSNVSDSSLNQPCTKHTWWESIGQAHVWFKTVAVGDLTGPPATTSVRNP